MIIHLRELVPRRRRRYLRVRVRCLACLGTHALLHCCLNWSGAVGWFFFFSGKNGAGDALGVV